MGAILIVGGITRLTQSGLSIVEWDPIMGTLPPLNNAEWSKSFELYKLSPEYHHYNSNFTLNDYKAIYFWEYLHRLLGRIIGVVFLVPCIYFWWRGYFNKALKKKVIIIFLWGAFQGVLGWVMVKSGLKDVPHVSHFKLAAHLLTAMALIMYLYWVALNVKYECLSNSTGINKWANYFLIVLLIQIVYGAFVAGLKAGLMYNTFPFMGDYWWPPEMNLIFERVGFKALINSASWTQLVHRLTAFILMIIFGVLLVKSRRLEMNNHIRFAVVRLGMILLLQVFLGIITLIYAVPISLGVIHQFVAVLLLLATTQLLFTLKTKN